MRIKCDNWESVKELLMKFGECHIKKMGNKYVVVVEKVKTKG